MMTLHEPMKPRSLTQLPLAIFCNWEFRLFWADVQSAPEPEIVAEVRWMLVQIGPRFRTGFGIRSVCGGEGERDSKRSLHWVSFVAGGVGLKDPRDLFTHEGGVRAGAESESGMRGSPPAKAGSARQAPASSIL